jgi:hypothetical protein
MEKLYMLGKEVDEGVPGGMVIKFMIGWRIGKSWGPGLFIYHLGELGITSHYIIRHCLDYAFQPLRRRDFYLRVSYITSVTIPNCSCRRLISTIEVGPSEQDT